MEFRAALNPVLVRRLVSEWLLEDGPGFDFGGYVVGDAFGSAVLFVKEDGVLAGVPFFEAIFVQLDCTVEWSPGMTDGSRVSSGQRVAMVRGATKDVLRGERVALNCLCRASGIATQARHLVDATASQGWPGKVAGTRKTTPGFRLVEKYALLVGGADTHRYDLSTMVMLKDNHVWSVGDIHKAVQKCREVSGFSLKVEVECRTVEEALEAAAAGSDVIMLDNFVPEEALRAAKTVKLQFPNIVVEVSGGVHPENILEFISPDIDVVSTSCLTQGYPSLDFSLKIVRGSHDEKF